MSIAQRIVLAVAFVIILGMVLFPPWVFVYDPPGAMNRTTVKTERPAGYRPVYADQVPRDEDQLVSLFNLKLSDRDWQYISLQAFSLRIDMTRLAIQIVATMLLTFLLILILKERMIDPTR